MSVTINLTINGSDVDLATPAEPKPVATPAAEPFDGGNVDFAGLLSGEEIVVGGDDETNEAEAVWHAKRSGRLTCSRFGDLMSSGRKKDEDFSQTGLSYLRLKLAERLGSHETISGPALQWGTDNEAEALRQYALRHNVEVDSEPYRFFEVSEYVGGTPDGLVGEDGCVEVKCPYNPATHIETLLSKTIPDRYHWQVVGHMYVTGRQWCDFVSFDPRIAGPKKLIVIRHQRHDAEIKQLTDKLKLAVEWLNNAAKGL